MGHLDTQNRAPEMQGKISKPRCNKGHVQTLQNKLKPRCNKGHVQTLQNKLTFVISGLCPGDPENSRLPYLATESHIYIIIVYC
jgi:hypothetical protein